MKKPKTDPSPRRNAGNSFPAQHRQGHGRQPCVAALERAGNLGKDHRTHQHPERLRRSGWCDERSGQADRQTQSSVTFHNATPVETQDFASLHYQDKKL